MALKHLNLQNFRNYKKLSVDLGKRTVLFGKNAQGKTNILEAVYLLCTLRSFRGKDMSLISWGEEFSSIEGEADEKLRIVVQNIEENIKKTAQKNGVNIRGQEFLRTFQAIIFSPEDVELIKASPGARRRHLDTLLCKLDQRYTESLFEFKKVLLQRNALLKNIKKKKSKEEELEMWDERFSELGGYLVQKREELIELINKDIDIFYKKISGKEEEVRLIYQKRYEEPSLGNALLKTRSIDIIYGSTSVGPHRDDVFFKKNEMDIKEFGSRGEFRTTVLALKLLEGEILEKRLGKKVTYLLDDVFSELDFLRRQSLMDIIEEKQVIITTTDLDHVTESFIKEADVYEVIDGSIVKLTQNDIQN